MQQCAHEGNQQLRIIADRERRGALIALSCFRCGRILDRERLQPSDAKRELKIGGVDVAIGRRDDAAV